jgi:hypothetical protein
MLQELGKWLVKNKSKARNTPVAHLSDVTSLAHVCDSDSDNYHGVSATVASDEQLTDLKVSTSSMITNIDIKNG